jgi:hypothetical protein
MSGAAAAQWRRGARVETFAGAYDQRSSMN